MSSVICVKAHAKINLLLNLLGVGANGFHEVRFVMQALELADELTVRPLGPGREVLLTCNMPELATPDNLVTQAYTLFYQHCPALSPQALSVKLTKNIPVQAGLGGGSSDAAAMLKVLNTLHENPLDVAQLKAMAAQLGSDVPFFLHGGTCLATGRGEVIQPLPALPPFEVVLLKPRHWGLSTPKAYQWIREAGSYKTYDFQPWEQLVHQAQPSPKDIAKLLYNDFEAVVFAHHPELALAKKTLLDIGPPGVLLSGSGPTLFGVLTDADSQWDAIQRHFPVSDWVLIRSRFHPSAK